MSISPPPKNLWGAAAALALLAPAVHADVVVPSGFDAISGGTFQAGPSAAAPAAYQAMISASALGLSAGDILTGVSFRQFSGPNEVASTPALSFADWEFYLGTPASGAISGSGATFATEMPSPTLVKDGALTIPAGGFTGDTGSSDVNSFGYVISFDTPFTYNGGDLGFLVRSSGTSQTVFLDAVSNANSDYGTLYRGMLAGGDASATEASNATTSVLIAQFQVPEPATWALGLLGMGAMAVRRRRR